jgi:hypothetical protein
VVVIERSTDILMEEAHGFVHDIFHLLLEEVGSLRFFKGLMILKNISLV